MRASKADSGTVSSSASAVGSHCRLLPLLPEIENPASTAEDADGVFVLSPRPDGGGFRT
jgi:hypothetical protein